MLREVVIAFCNSLSNKPLNFSAAFLLSLQELILADTGQQPIYQKKAAPQQGGATPKWKKSRIFRHLNNAK